MWSLGSTARLPRLLNLGPRLGVAGLAVIDVLTGALLMVWPGAFQEWAHPLAMGVAFYSVQRTGAVWLVRGLLAGYAAARGRRIWAGVLAASWAIGAPADLLVAWRTADTGPWAAGVHAGHGAVAVLAGVLAWRLLDDPAEETKRTAHAARKSDER